MLIYIIILILVIIWLIIRLGIKSSSNFWSSQPVFHTYNLFYKLYPPGIITQKLPEKTKWYNDINIRTNKYSNISSNDLTIMSNLICDNYYNTSEIHYNPSKNEIDAYFSKDMNSYIGFYINDQYLFEQKKEGINIIKDDDIIGVFASRKINMLIHGNFMPVHYVDYLCISNQHRKKQIVPQLVETCYRYLRMDNKHIAVCLFKRENKLMNWVVPLTQYNAYGYNLDLFKLQVSLPSNITLISIGKNNYNIIYEHMSFVRKQYDCFIQSDMGVIMELLKKSQMYIYILIQNHNPLTVYIFKDGNTLYNNKKTIECISSHNTSNSSSLFINGFYHAIEKFKKEYGYLIMENVSHNDKIINNIHLRIFPNMNTKMAYYFYNFALASIKPDKLFAMF